MNALVRNLICRMLGHHSTMPMLNIVEGCQLQTPDGRRETVTMCVLTRVCRRCGSTLEMCPGGIIPNAPAEARRSRSLQPDVGLPGDPTVTTEQLREALLTHCRTSRDQLREIEQANAHDDGQRSRTVGLVVGRTDDLMSLSLEVERQLYRRGWDRTTDGWVNAKTGERGTMEEALRREIDKANNDLSGTR